MAEVEPEEFSLMLPNGLRIAGKQWLKRNQGDSKFKDRKILALHGWLDNASTWDGIGPILAEIGYVVVCLDFVGHGKSDHYPNGEYSDSTMNNVATVTYSASVLGWNSFILMGHSMGAAVATVVAAALPNLVTSLILIEGLGPWPRNRGVVEGLQIALHQRNINFFERKPKTYPTVQSAIDKLRENNKNLAEHSAQVIVRRSLVKVQGGFSFSHDPRLVSLNFYQMPDEDIKSIIESIRCPTLIFWTKATLDSYHSRFMIKEKSTYQEIYQDRMLLINPQCRNVVILEEGSHHVHLDHPALVSEHIIKFLMTERMSPAKL